MAKPKVYYHEFKDYYLPIYLYKEYRSSLRFAMGKKGLLIRCPKLLTESKIIDKAVKWAENLSTKNPGALRSFLIKDYPDRFDLLLMATPFSFEVKASRTNRDTIHWHQQSAILQISNDHTRSGRSKAIKELLIKYSTNKFLTEVTNRVHHLNQQHFPVEINHIRLKYNYTNWGSCSTKGNINLSSRLLLVPDNVMDYVIIHELSHRIEMNHSPSFWKLVKSKCPDYKQQAHWLKVNGATIDF